MDHLSFLGARCIVSVLAGAAAIALAAPAFGAIVPGTSARQLQVSADNGSGPLTDGVSTAGPGLFDEERQVLAFDPAPPQKLARGTARQLSNVNASVISANGLAQTNLALAVTTLAPSQAEASARSSFVIEFALDAQSSYTLNGFVDTSAVMQGGAALPMLANAVLLEALDTSTTLFETLTDDESFALAGTLGPGNYRITAFADTQAALTSGVQFLSSQGNNSFSLTFIATATGVPVSEPGVPALLAAAALAAACVRRRSPRPGRAPVARP